jgi:hypothetical protein
MPEPFHRGFLVPALIIALGVLTAEPALAQGTIVCWKDKSGKVLGCGDTIPPEYRDNAANRLDRKGMKRGTVESAEEAARRRAQEEATAQQKAEEKRRAAEQQRLDAALLNTYATEKEIDDRRNRELQQADLAIVQLQAPLQNATERYNDAKKRNAKEEMARAEADKLKYEREIAAKEKDKAEIAERYAMQKKRYVELRGAASASAAASPAPGRR